MKTFSLNLNVCSICKSTALAAALLLAPLSAKASPDPKILDEIRADLKKRESVQFANLLERWKLKHGSLAIEPLKTLLTDPHESDPNRYIALMGLAQMDGSSALPSVRPLLKDHSWMLRSGALRFIATWGNSWENSKNPVELSTVKEVFPLLKDPALVVRTEAVQTLGVLHPEGTTRALIHAFVDPGNYHKGRPQWVPQRSFSFLKQHKWSAKDRAELRALAPWFSRCSDKKFTAQVIEQLPLWTGKKVPSHLSSAQKIAFWRKQLLR